MLQFCFAIHLENKAFLRQTLSRYDVLDEIARQASPQH